MLAMTRASQRRVEARTYSARVSVLFNGEWSSEEKHRVEEAALAIEARRERTAPLPSMGCEWVCNCHEIRGVRYFMAHWSGRASEVLMAGSAAELAARMLAVASV